MKMRNGWLVRVADFWTDRRPLPSGLDGGRRVRECTPSPCLLCKHWHSTRMRTLFSKSSVKNSKTCNDKSYVARSELCVFYAAPQIMRTPLFRLEIHEVRFFWGGRGLASRAAAKWGLSSGWVLYGVFDDFLSSEFFFAFGKPPETRDDSSWRFNSSSARYSRALRSVCTKLLSGQIQETRLWSSWQHVPAVNLVW